jgi:hypothetical protein
LSGKVVFFGWCFDGEFVVIAWWNVVFGWAFSAGRKFANFSGFIF